MACTFVIGGARSGKSRYAEQRAADLSKQLECTVTYVATAQITDDEMWHRIERHRQGRPQTWQTVEIPMDVASYLRQHAENDVSHTHEIVLVDCLSLLLNNWMFHEQCSEQRFFERLNDLVDAISHSEKSLIVVSNEVGAGIVPGDSLSRSYRDWLGLMNQAIAAVSDSVILVVAGIPVDLRRLQAP